MQSTSQPPRSEPIVSAIALQPPKYAKRNAKEARRVQKNIRPYRSPLEAHFPMPLGTLRNPKPNKPSR